MKNLLTYLLAIMAFVACSDSGTDNGGGGGGQETPKQPEITLSTTAANFTTDGGSDVITFTSSEAWTAEVINSRADEWCSIDPKSGAAGSAKITVTTTANDTPDDRTASIIIKAGTASKTINVSQKQKDALTVTSSKFEVPAEGGEVSIEVKANIDFEYTIEKSAADWVEYKATRALKTSNLVFEIKENDDTEKREAKITIKSGGFSEVVTIYQLGSEPTIVLSQSEYNVPSTGETIAVEVKSNVDVEVVIPSNVKWVKESSTRAFSTNTYYFDIEQNDNYDSRTAEITFINKENNIQEKIKIAQSQKNAIVIAEDSYTVDNDGGEIVIEVQHNIDYDIAIADSWISQKQTRGLATDKLTFVVAENKSGEDRTSTIKFTSDDGKLSQTVTVHQTQDDTLKVSSSKFEVEADGEQITIEVKANIEFDFEIDEDAEDWITHRATRAMKTTTLVFDIAENKDSKEREANITISGGDLKEVVTITQEGLKPEITLSQDEFTVSSSKETISVKVESNVDVEVVIPSRVKWVKQKTTRATTTTTYYFEISANEDYNDREAEIEFVNEKHDLSESITITQKQKDAIVLAKESYTVDNEGGDIVIEVGHNVDYDITIADSWITQKQTRAYTTDRLTFTVAANTSDEARESTIKFTSKDKKITQTVRITQTSDNDSELENPEDGGTTDW